MSLVLLNTKRQHEHYGPLIFNIFILFHIITLNKYTLKQAHIIFNMYSYINTFERRYKTISNFFLFLNFLNKFSENFPIYSKFSENFPFYSKFSENFPFYSKFS